MNLVVMAAGMGSRFGGLKQLTSVGPNGEFLIDYSIYDAIKAGVEKVIFVIKEEHLEMFHETVGKRLENHVKVEYAFQKIDDLPDGVKIDFERIKPWGTGQAVLASRKCVDSNFMVINADDFYGRDAFVTLGNFLKNVKSDGDKEHYAMVAYKLINTLSKNGFVSRGVCQVKDGYLDEIVERKHVGYVDDRLVYVDDDEMIDIDKNTPVSVNLFGFTPKVFEKAEEYFKEFFMDDKDKHEREFYLPTIARKAIDDGSADMKVLKTTSHFNGMTYLEDLDGVRDYIESLIEKGVYPENLWGE
ncbi:MAG: sugar phosphate nucleotidyltransferase [Bacilli bacterium]|nr:sugar phosphate nucleotidyltransferase [Bacilli bacterium]